MRRFMRIVLFLYVSSCALGQIGTPSSDVLGAHLNYGRGCAACHAPHSGAYGNGAAKHAQTTANSYLWGQDTQSLLGQTMTFSGSTVVNLPAAEGHGLAQQALGVLAPEVGVRSGLGVLGSAVTVCAAVRSMAGRATAAVVQVGAQYVGRGILHLG